MPPNSHHNKEISPPCHLAPPALSVCPLPFVLSSPPWPCWYTIDILQCSFMQSILTASHVMIMRPLTDFHSLWARNLHLQLFLLAPAPRIAGEGKGGGGDCTYWYMLKTGPKRQQLSFGKRGLNSANEEESKQVGGRQVWFGMRSIRWNLHGVRTALGWPVYTRTRGQHGMEL